MPTSPSRYGGIHSGGLKMGVLSLEMGTVQGSSPRTIKHS